MAKLALCYLLAFAAIAHFTDAYDWKTWNLATVSRGGGGSVFSRSANLTSHNSGLFCEQSPEFRRDCACGAKFLYSSYAGYIQFISFCLAGGLNEKN